MRIPASTYRLQVTESFDLYDAARSVAYLHDLGVDWVYLSPLLRAEPGSEHGYDVVDPTVVDPARGGRAGLEALSAEARRLGMGVLVDIVPNHMGVATPTENPWWCDLLRHGRASAYADAFDVDWEANDGRILLPVVADDDLLPDGRIAHLAVADGALCYHDLRLPLAEGTGTGGFETGARAPSSTSGARDADPDADAPSSSSGASGGADAVHARQHYELVSWRRGDRELNYRRFFSITTLAGLRVEDPRVFAESHAEVARWFAEGLVDGLRIDHPDGLRDPASYLDALRDLTDGAYVVVEKILEPGEVLPTSWATAGTTGYDVLGEIDRVLTDPAGREPLTALEARLRGEAVDWADLVHDRKRAVADQTFAAEIGRLTREIGVGDAAVTDALAELLGCFPTYRSYLPEGRADLTAAFAEAQRRRPDLMLALEALEPVLSDPAHPAALRFQQTSGAVMAKGVEDNAFYRFGRLLSLNEVGGDPSEFSVCVREFHERMAERQRTRPHALTATTTHDTKRSEDVRARIAVLAERPDLWVETLDRLLDLAPLPDPGFGNVLWQAVVGCWPADRERIHAYAEKAMREAGDRTTWTDVDATYEKAVHDAVDAAYDDPDVGRVLDDLVARLAGPGWSNSLSAKLLALTVPGIPDVYQGSELWALTLVDPDNRRLVRWAERRAVLDRLLTGERPVLTPAPDDHGHAKLLVTQLALTLRRTQPERFTTYAAVPAEGPAADHVLAFDRGGALTVATRLPVGLAAHGWGDTGLRLPEGHWVDLLTGRSHTEWAPLSEVVADHPVALLISTGSPDPGAA
ncbi:MAG: malto-oligosyltrehalose synthase [Nocardioides sp.]